MSKAISMFGSTIDPKGYVKPGRVAKLLDIHRSTLHSWIAAGKIIKPVNINGALRFKVSEIIRWIELNIK